MPEMVKLPLELETSEVLATELAQKMEELGAAEIIYTDIYRDGTMEGRIWNLCAKLLTLFQFR